MQLKGCKFQIHYNIGGVSHISHYMNLVMEQLAILGCFSVCVRLKVEISKQQLDEIKLKVKSDG